MLNYSKYNTLLRNNNVSIINGKNNVSTILFAENGSFFLNSQEWHGWYAIITITKLNLNL